MMNRLVCLFVVAVMCVCPVCAQDKLVTEFPYTEGWEEDVTLWALADMDGDEEYSLSYSTFWPCHSGWAGVRSVSLQDEPCDHWVISPRLAIPSDQFLIEWWCCNYLYPGRSMEHIDVLVSRTGYDTADFDTVIFSYTFSEEVNPSQSGHLGDFVRMTADLGAFAGDTVHVAFRHRQSHGYWLLLDDIMVADGSLLVYGIDGPDMASVGDVGQYSVTSPIPDRFSYEWEINGDPVLVPDTGQSVTIAWDSDIPRGHYDLQCHITNRISGDTVTLRKDIFFDNCEHSISDFPYFEDFSDPTCWSLYELGVPYGEDCDYMIARGGLFVGDPYNETLRPVYGLYSFQGEGSSSWAVSPEIELNQPDLEVRWKSTTSLLSSARVVLAYTFSEPDETVDTTQFVALCDTVISTNTLQPFSVCMPPDLMGRVFRLAFCHREESVQDPSDVLITDFEIAPSRAPVIDSIYGSRKVSVGAEMNYWADVASGEAPSFSWTFEGDSVQTYDSSTAVVVWTRPGIFQVTLDVGNQWGTVHDTFFVEVADCGIKVAPFQSELVEELPCWTQRNISNDRSAWESYGSRSVRSDSYGPETDHWLISPAIFIPEEDEYEFVSHAVLEGQGGIGTVLLSASGPRLDAFTDTLVRFTSSLTQIPSLARYRGDTVWIAFRHQQQGEGLSYLYIPDAMVVDAAVPRVRLLLDHHPVADRPDTIVAERENPDVAVDGYEWKIDGQLLADQHDSVLIYTFPQGVTTIAVTACNAAGCGTATDSVTARAPVAIPDVILEPDPVVTLIPNPARGHVTVASSFRLRSVEAYDLMGHRWLLSPLSGYAESLDISVLTAGTYLFRVQTTQGVVTKKLLVK